MIPSQAVSCAGEGRITTDVDGESRGLCWYWQLAAISLALALIISRQPEAIFHPQFYGEDGHVWFADAYNRGWFISLFRTQDGYYQTLPRLAAALALVFPLAFAPLVTNLVGLAVQLLPVPVLLSRRLSRWGLLPFRGILALVYLALPNSREVNVTVTEAQWHLAFLASLLVLAEAPRSRLGRIFDLVIFGLCGVTGPFCILLLPISLLFWWLRRQSWTLVAITELAFGAGLQSIALLQTVGARAHKLPLGSGVEELARILGSQVYAAAFIGSNPLASIAGTGMLMGVAVVGTALLAYASYRAGLEFRLFVLVSILLFAASLASPMPGWPGSAKTAWEFLAGRPAIHYWFFPTLAFSWGIIGLLMGSRRTQASQALGVLLVLVMLIGLVRDWRYIAFQDFKFAEHAQMVATSKRGDIIVIPETPPGWTLRLVKK